MTDRQSPAAAPPTARHGPPVLRAASQAARNKAEAPRILLVEDDFLVATDLEAGLSQAGFVVVGIAATADEAVLLAQSESPGLAIMDVRLAGKRDGVEAALEIFSKTGIRCIFATAHSDRHIRARAEASRPFAWLPKPYAIASLVAAVRAALTQISDNKN